MFFKLFIATALLLPFAQQEVRTPHTLTPQQAEFVKPTIVSIKSIPADPIEGGTCKADTSGYLGALDRKDTEGYPARDLTDKELGADIRTDLEAGYVLTVYRTKSGFFVNAECSAIRMKK